MDMHSFYIAFSILCSGMNDNQITALEEHVKWRQACCTRIIPSYPEKLQLKSVAAFLNYYDDVTSSMPPSLELLT